MSKIQAASILAAIVSAATAPVSAAAPAPDTGKIAAAVKADVAQLVVDFNAHDAARAAGHDAPDVVVMASGQPNITGVAADAAGFKTMFAADPTTKIARVAETVDVAASGDMAVYRSTYVQSEMRANKPVMQKVNFLAGYRPQADGSWKMQWYVVSDMGPAQPIADPQK